MTAGGERFVLRSTVRECRPSGSQGFLLTTSVDQTLPRELEGGHFFMLRAEDAEFPFLNRPFSVHSAGPASRGPELQFLFKVVGSGTASLARLRAGDPLHLVGPLGQPFPMHVKGRTTVLVAGGVGFPPLHLYLRRHLQRDQPENCILLYGARSRDQLFELDGLRGLDVEIHTATEDGSDGLCGRVDGLLERVLEAHAGQALRILTCGPDPMMTRVAEIAAEHQIPCWVSLETFMACGFGVCNACAVPRAESEGEGFRYARACLDGPVFDATTIAL
jgi:dihydroorotate dehydrogenase electron transfer subunit